MILESKCYQCKSPVSVHLPDDVTEHTATVISHCVLCDGCNPSASNNAPRGNVEATAGQTGRAGADGFSFLGR